MDKIKISINKSNSDKNSEARMSQKHLNFEKHMN